MRVAPLMLVVIVLAGLAFLLWPDGGEPGSTDFTPEGAAAAAPEAGVLGAADSAALTRATAQGSLLVRVLDARGQACAATVHGKVNGVKAQLRVRDGMLTLPPPVEKCELMAESGGAWSALTTWTSDSGSAREIVLRLEDQTGASLRIHVSVEGEGPAAAPVAQVVAWARRGGLGEVFEGFEFREGLRDSEAREPAASRPAVVEAPEAARARLLRENLAEESWQGSAGWIEIKGLLPGAWSFLITQDGCAPEFLDVTLLPMPAEREVLLRRAGSVAGRVLGPDGQGLAGVEIGLWSKPESEIPWFDPLDDFERYGRMPGAIPPHHLGLTGFDGRFVLPLVRPGSYDLLAVTESLRPAVGGPLLVQGQQRAEAGDLTLLRGHTLQARVVDLAGKPVSGALLGWRAGETTMAVLAAGAKPSVTNTDGMAQISALPGGAIEAEITAPGFARARETFTFQDPPRETKVWEVVLRAGAVLPGSVLSGGMPVSGATVRVMPTKEALPFMQQLLAVEAATRTAPDGSFRFDNLPIGAWRVQVTHDDHSAFTSPDLNLLEGENPPLLVHLSPGATLRVTVLDETGAPVPQTTIMAMESSMQAQENGITGPDGVAVLSHLRAGNWQVMRMDLAGLEAGKMPEDFQVRFEYVELAEGELKEITLGGAVVSATIEGRVTVSGVPQKGRMVILIGKGGVKTASSNADGEFILEKVEVGDYLVSVMMGLGGGSSWTGSIEVTGGGVQRHDLALPSSIIEVLVVDGATGQVVQGIPVNLRPEDSSSVSGGSFQSTDGQGLARFEMLTPGTYLAAVGNLAMPMLGGGEGRGSAMISGIRVASEDAGTQRVEARLPAPATLRLRVAGPDGAYLAGVHVYYLDAEGNNLNSLSMKPTNAKGVVELIGLPPGLGHFVARHPQLGRVEFETMLTAGEISKQEVTLGKGVHLMLTVVNAKGEPIGGVLAVLEDARGHVVNFMITIEESQEIQKAWYSGTALRIGPLTPGPYTVRLTRPGQATVQHKVTVTPEPAEQPLRLRFAPE